MRNWATVLVTGTAFWIAYAGTSVFASSHSKESVKRQADALPARNPLASADGEHLIVYLITASDCGWSTRPSVLQSVATLRSRLTARYSSRFASISLVAVVLDLKVRAGLEFLEMIGGADAFDQVAVGGSWLNDAAVRLIWQDGVARPASPQVVVSTRRVNSREFVSAGSLTVGPERVVRTFVGGDEVVLWIQSDVPLNERTGSHNQPVVEVRPQQGYDR